MTGQPTLRISIPNPCSENFAAMLQSGDGKFCSHCNKVIYDFSQMNDDELLDFLKHKSTIPCGRFHNSQLQRDILPLPKRKNILYRFNKIAAAFFTVLS